MQKFIMGFCLLLLSVTGGATAMAQQEKLETNPLSIATEGATHAFIVEIADDPDEISTGMMERTEMGADEGMLFDFGGLHEPSMWMKNTILSLDMVFIAEDGKIVMIAENTTPYSERQISPRMPVRAVLELNAGRTRALDIKAGDEVIHELFGNLADTLTDTGEDADSESAAPG